VVSQSLLRHFIFCAHILNFLPAVWQRENQIKVAK
jgi:hypothetical protein